MQFLIEGYINNLNLDDIYKFAKENNIILSDGEAKFIFIYVKQNWRIILQNPNNLDIEQHKNKFSPSNFEKIKKLINIYYQKYKDYL